MGMAQPSYYYSCSDFSTRIFLPPYIFIHVIVPCRHARALAARLQKIHMPHWILDLKRCRQGGSWILGALRGLDLGSWASPAGWILDLGRGAGGSRTVRDPRQAQGTGAHESPHSGSPRGARNQRTTDIARRPRTPERRRRASGQQTCEKETTHS